MGNIIIAVMDGNGILVSSSLVVINVKPSAK